MRRFLADLWIALALFAGNLSILGPFLLTEYSNQPWNNSYVYMAISRMFRDHPWTWNRLQYAGAPFHYLYPPLFHVLTAAIPFVSIGRAFHIVTGSGYALVPVSLYVLALQLFRSRPLAALTAVAYSIFPSPVYYALPTWKTLAAPYGNAPWGFVAIAGYEEAAHAFAFSLTLLAIAAAWRDKWVISALLAAAVFLTNWPALIGLGLILVALALTRSRDSGFVSSGLRVAGIAGTAYGLSAFWMTPGYFVSSTLLNRIVIRHTNSPVPWNTTTVLILLAAAALICLSFWRRVPPACSLVVAWIAVAGAVVAAFSVAGTWLVPMPNRYMLELNAASLLAIAGVISLLPKWRNLTVAAVLVIGLIVSFPFLSRAWRVQAPSVDPKSLISFQISEWLQHHQGMSRALASGELDSTLALWSDVPQAGGTGQDVSNFLMFAAQREVVFGCGGDSAKVADLWLRAMNVTAFVVHGARSREAFHWFSEPGKFTGWPVAWDNGAGDTIYKIPSQNEAVVVDLAALRRLPAMRSTADKNFLEAYVSWAAGKRPAQVHWEADDRAILDADLGPDEAILLKSNYDIGWRASNGQLTADPIGFLLIHGVSPHDRVDLRFGASWDAWLGRAITFVTIILLLARIPGSRIAAVSLLPAIVAYGLLVHRVPSTAQVAEEAFARLQPPLINLGGVVDSVTNQGPPFLRGHALSLYGANFGAARDSTQVWIGNQQAEVLYRQPNMISLNLPGDPPPKMDVSVEVNGCRGNAFEFDTR